MSLNTGIGAATHRAARRTRKLRAASGAVVESLERRLQLSAGDLDPSFGSSGVSAISLGSAFANGRATTMTSIAVQSDGKIVMAGNLGEAGSLDYFGLRRFNADGSPDQSIGLEGVKTFATGMAAGVAIQGDGKILLGGYEYWGQAAGGDLATVARLNSDGTPDPSFNAAGRPGSATGLAGDQLTAVALQGDGKVLAVGVGTANDVVAYRFNADGTPDTAFGANGRASFNTGVVTYPAYSLYADAVTLQGDGKIVVSASSLSFDTTHHGALFRLTASGALDPTFGSGGFVRGTLTGTGFQSVALQGDGKIVTGYGSGYNGAQRILRFNADGTLDATYGQGGVATIATGGDAVPIVLQSDGKLVVAGLTYPPAIMTPVPTGVGVTRLNVDGSIDGAFAPDAAGTRVFHLRTYDNVGAMTIQPDGKMLVGGTGENFTSGVPCTELARYDAGAVGPAVPAGAASFTLAGLAPYAPTGLAQTFTVTARDVRGVVAPGYRGTVHFTAPADRLAVLPADYTFTAADNGSHTFTVTFNTPGTTQAIVATDVADGSVAGAALGLQVHELPAKVVPIDAKIPPAYDATRNVLYYVSLDSTLQRFDLTTQRVLPPLPIVDGRAVDVTADGKYAYTVRGTPYVNSLYRVDLATGALATFTYPVAPNDSSERSIVIAANGVGFIANYTNGFAVPLRRFNVTTGVVTNVTLPAGDGIYPTAALARSADGSLVAIYDGNGHLVTYDANTDAFSGTVAVVAGRVQLAVNADGSRIAVQTAAAVLVYDRALNLLMTLPAAGGGIAFDPARDVLYAASFDATQVTGYDLAAGGAAVATIPTGATFYGAAQPGYTTLASAPGGWLFLTGVGYLRTFNLTDVPTADAGGPYTVTEGQTVKLSAALSYGARSPIVGYEWDLNYDGVTFRPTATGPAPVVSAVGLDGPSTRTVAVRVTDAAGHTAIATAVVTVTDAAPLITVKGQHVAFAGPYTIELVANDPGPDTVRTWTIQWGDGAVQVVSGGNDVFVTHTYAAADTEYQIIGRATNEDDSYSFGGSYVQVVAPPTIAADGTLTLLGINSSIGDTIDLTVANGNLQYTLDGAVAVFPLSAFSRVKLAPRYGNDVVTVHGPLPGTAAAPSLLDLSVDYDTVTFFSTPGSPTPAPVSVVGTSGQTVIVIQGTGGDDVFTAGSSSASLAGLLTVNFTNVTSVTLAGGAGNDTFNAAGAFSAVYTLNGDDGDDTFNVGGGVSSSAFTANGGNGDDTMRLDFSSNSLPRTATFNGGAGNNVVSITGTTSSDTLTAGASNRVTFVVGGSTSTVTAIAAPLIRFQGNGGNDTVSVTGGAWQIDAGSASATNVTTTIAAGASATFTAARSFGRLTVNGSLSLATATRQAFTVGTLTLGAGATLDVGQDVLLLDATKTPIATVRSAVKQAYNYNASQQFGFWDGVGGITSADAVNSVKQGNGRVTLAVVDGTAQSRYGFNLNKDLGGPVVGTNQVAVLAALMGDVNLDGRVNADDTSTIAQFNAFNKPAAPDGWLDGDFNYDGLANADDVSLIAQTRTFNSGIVYGGPIPAAAADAANAIEGVQRSPVATVGFVAPAEVVPSPGVIPADAIPPAAPAEVSTPTTAVASPSLPTPSASPTPTSEPAQADAPAGAPPASPYGRHARHVAHAAHQRHLRHPIATPSRVRKP